MEDSVTVDTNSGEDSVFQHLKTRLGEGLVKRKRLDVGDFEINAGGWRVIVERKSIADLVSSLKDGRRREQKARQMAAMSEDAEGRTRVVWVVEGPLATWHSSLPITNFPVSQMEAAVISTNVRDNIPVLRCVDTLSVAETIIYLHKRCVDNEMDCIAASQKAAAAGYGALVHVKKAKNVDKAVAYKMMLATIPGCSMVKAEALFKHFPTMVSLVDESRSPGAIKMISNIEVGSRKIGPVVAKRILEIIGV